MNKLKINFWVDVGLAVTFFGSFITGLVKWPGLLRWFGLTHRSLPMKEITLIHDWSGLIMGLIVLVHLILHWNMIVCMTKNMFRRGEKQCT